MFLCVFPSFQACVRLDDGPFCLGHGWFRHPLWLDFCAATHTIYVAISACKPTCRSWWINSLACLVVALDFGISWWHVALVCINGWSSFDHSCVECVWIHESCVPFCSILSLCSWCLVAWDFGWYRAATVCVNGWRYFELSCRGCVWIWHMFQFCSHSVDLNDSKAETSRCCVIFCPLLVSHVPFHSFGLACCGCCLMCSDWMDSVLFSLWLVSDC